MICANTRILVYRIGSLGDTLVAVPALRALRAAFPGATLTLLTNVYGGMNMVGPENVLGKGHLVDRYITYPSGLGYWSTLLAYMQLWKRLRRERFDVIAYLAPSARPFLSIVRDWLFFKTSGGRRFVGFWGLRSRRRYGATQNVCREADLLLERLGHSGIHVPPHGQGEISIGISPDDEKGLQQWLERKGHKSGGPWIGIGPGANMPVKRWPMERYCSVISVLIERYNIWPVVLGGPEDRELGEMMIGRCGRGYNAAGELNVREAGAALKRCLIYLGNDTGTMHLAASVGTRCLAIFSSRNSCGLWYPYGENHVVLETPINCSGCLLIECIDRKMECILGITEADVAEVSYRMLAEVLEQRNVAL